MARQIARRAGRRADLRWTLGTATLEGIATGGNAASIVLSQGNTSQTIMRVRGHYFAVIDGPTLNDVVTVGLGLLIVQAGAAAASVPLTDGDAPYFWYEVFHLFTETGTAEDTIGGTLVRGVIDGKAMRILRPDQEVLLVAQTGIVVGAPVVDVGFTGRFLIAD